MATTRKMHDGLYTEVKRVVDGQVKQTCCCCKAPGTTPKDCAAATGNKTPCRCDCHSSVINDWQKRGKRCREVRINLGMGLRQFADKNGWLPSDLCDMENGRQNPLPAERVLGLTP